MNNQLEQWFYAVPPITRTYMTAAVLTTLACQMQVVTPFKLYFDLNLVLYKYELWRLLTNFFFFGTLGIDVIFHLFFMVRYSRMLEEGYFRNRPADYLFMLLFGASLMLTLAPFVTMNFLGPALMFMMVYIWARKNPHVLMNFMGMFNFKAPWLPWILLVVSLLMNEALPIVDLVGVIVGHIYFYFEDIYPKISRGRRILQTPRILIQLFQPADYDPLHIEPLDLPDGQQGVRQTEEADLTHMEDETQPIQQAQPPAHEHGHDD